MNHYTADELKVELQTCGFHTHTGLGPYLAAGTLSNFNRLLERAYERSAATLPTSATTPATVKPSAAKPIPLQLVPFDDERLNPYGVIDLRD